jgi:tyrosyl-tRNA synthetase
MGGSDQWGNIVNGIDLGRRLAGAELFALTTPLLTTSSGAKMGKTETGAVWLNAEMMRPYDYWQFWRNCEDGDVGRLLKLFTDCRSTRSHALPRSRGRSSTKPRRFSPPRRPPSCTAARRGAGRRNRPADVRGGSARGDASQH